ncbi:MAG: PA2779 family protein [Sulfurifustaceae bacterium]
MKSPRQLRTSIVGFFFCCALSLAVAVPASAAIVSTEDAMNSGQAAELRAQLKALVQRPELATQLQTLGVPPEQAVARVDAMTDAEVRALAGKLGDLPAGGRLSNNELILILVLIIVLALAL